jgi:hypothetical protein
MKFIKKFEAILEEYFSEEEVSDIRDMYIDLVDDLNLITVDDESELTKSMCSFFKVNKQFSIGNKLNSKIFSINLIIRTADLNDYSDYTTYAISGPEDRDRYNFVYKNIQPFINRLKSIGYDVYKNDLDLKIDSWKYITSGIKIIITK